MGAFSPGSKYLYFGQTEDVFWNTAISLFLSQHSRVFLVSTRNESKQDISPVYLLLLTNARNTADLVALMHCYRDKFTVSKVLYTFVISNWTTLGASKVAHSIWTLYNYSFKIPLVQSAGGASLNRSVRVPGRTIDVVPWQKVSSVCCSSRHRYTFEICSVNGSSEATGYTELNRHTGDIQETRMQPLKMDM